jgi:hypothetical protein
MTTECARQDILPQAAPTLIVLSIILNLPFALLTNDEICRHAMCSWTDKILLISLTLLVRESEEVLRRTIMTTDRRATPMSFLRVLNKRKPAVKSPVNDDIVVRGFLGCFEMLRWYQFACPMRVHEAKARQTIEFDSVHKTTIRDPFSDVKREQVGQNRSRPTQASSPADPLPANLRELSYKRPCGPLSSRCTSSSVV